MGHQKKRQMLEPVLENYMGPPISYSTSSNLHNGTGTECKKPMSSATKQSKSSVWNFLVKMRDRYVKAMNEMAMGGDYTGMAGYHGCVAGVDYPGTVEHYRSAAEEHEIEALREELAALRRERDRLEQSFTS